MEQGYSICDLPARRLAHLEDPNGSALERWLYAASTRVVAGSYEEPELMAFGELNAVRPRPRTVQQDTRLSHFTTAGGEWEEYRVLEPTSGGRVYRLNQTKSEADSTWTATHVGTLPADPNFCFTLERTESPHDHDEAGFPSHVSVTFGNGLWLIRFSSEQDAGIWRYLGGLWQQVRQVSVDATGRPVIGWVCVVRGALCVSFDSGQRWEIIRDKTAITLAAGPLVFSGVASPASIGVHQLAFDIAHYTTYNIPIYEVHMAAPSATFTGLRPTGTRWTWQEIFSPLATHKHQVGLHPSTFLPAGFTFEFYRVPELYRVLVSWPTILASPIGSTVDLTQYGVTEIDLVEPHAEAGQLGPRSGRLSVFWPPTSSFSGAYGYRLLSLALGYYMDDGTWALTARAVLYVIQPEPSARPWESEVDLELIDLWWRAEQTEVDEGWAPMDGFTCLAARNAILLKMGLPPSRGAWINTGRVLPAGPIDAPLWQPGPGMTAAQLFRALDVFEDVETFTDPAGNWTTRVARYTDAGVSFDWDGDPADPTLAILGMQNRMEHREVKTAHLAQGVDARGGPFFAYLYNLNLERNPASPGFIGFRIRNDCGIKVSTLAEAMLVVTQQAALNQAAPIIPEVEVPGAPTLFRGARVRLLNAEHAGVFDTNHFRVEGLQHSWRPEKSRTTTGQRLRRIV